MEGEKKRGRGWWALAGIGLLTLLLALYVGAYYASVDQIVTEYRGIASASEFYVVTIGGKWIHVEPFFRPMHWIDRTWIRPTHWNPSSPVNPPAPSDDPPEISN